MNETLFQNLIFLGIMSSTLKGRNSNVKMKMTPIINPFGIVERVCVTFYTDERDKKEFVFSSQELGRFTWQELKKLMLPVVSLMELSA